VAVADSFQGPCFLWRRTDVAGDGQRPGVVVAGLGGGGGAERQFAEAVQRLGLAEQVAEVIEQRQGLLMAGGGRRVVPCVLLDEAEVVQRVCLAEPVAEVAEQRQGLLLAGSGRRVIPGLFLSDPRELRA